MRSLLLFALLTACVDQGPAQTEAQPWHPSAALVDSLWRATEACAGVTGDVQRIAWYVVVADRIPWRGPDVRGVWYSDHRIYLAEPNYPTWQPWGQIIQHEMLHDLLGTGEHPPAFAACGL